MPNVTSNAIYRDELLASEEFPKLSQLTRANFRTLSIMEDMTSLLGMYNRQMVAILGLRRVLH